MRIKTGFIIAFFSILVLSCINKSDDETIACTEEYIYGINVIVRDAQTNFIITEGVTVTVDDGGYHEELQLIANFDTFVGAGERARNYIVTVTADSYQTFTSETIEILSDDCHVIPEVLQVQLIPN